MKITIISVGKLKEKFWREAAAEYSKRLSGYCDLNFIEIPDINPGSVGGDDKAVEKEGAAICSALEKVRNNSTYTISLYIEGKQFDSLELSKKLDSLKLNGFSHFVFIVGGSCGTSTEVLQNIDFKLSLGKITLPHNLAKIVLLEQLYRVFKISNGETYHK